jgi:2',3'-cyclic-nucleotide 2'-phosphodiesterase (5'-nucleotidase family)
VYDPAAPAGQRIRQLTLGDGSRLDERRRYRVIMTDFMASGGDGAQLAREAVVEELNRVDLDAFVDHLRATPGGRFAPSAALKAPRITTISR